MLWPSILPNGHSRISDSSTPFLDLMGTAPDSATMKRTRSDFLFLEELGEGSTHPTGAVASLIGEVISELQDHFPQCTSLKSDAAG